MTTTKSFEVPARAAAILDFWFGPMDDRTTLNREAEPFATYFQRWYGKNPAVDAAIREQFEPDLAHVTGDGRNWDDTVRQWRAQPRGMLALTILVDQLPRNMYRDSLRMYTHDAPGLLTSEAARADITDDLPLVHRMFVSVPLMHVENLTLQERMLADFEGLLELARTRSPQNVGFYQFALDYAKRHVDVIRQYARFPHRNSIFGRSSTPEETEFLKRADAYF